jgi:hypothetical protein
MHPHCLEHHGVERVELDPQGLARRQHRPHHGLQSRLVAGEFDHPHLKGRRRYMAHLQAERLEGAADLVLQPDSACLQGFAIREQQPQLLAFSRLHVDRSEPADPHGLGDRACVVAIGLDRHNRGRALHAPRLDAYRGHASPS